ncbi:MAG TPA: ArsI/CadI family heavy metal resistance metalloenzyme [Nitriliruptorales bacterium]|nr:ArsI/CadI family heavy metal resistance metalloenzyme [Nitriliruptorales bacterium]
MSRIQLAMNVTDLDAAVAFYSQLLDRPPHKVREGYANFAVDDPPLKLVLTQDAAVPGGSLNHLGIEVGATEDVAATNRRLSQAGLVTDVRVAELCCHAVQDKVWVRDPDGAAWEVYTVIDDEPEPTAVASADGTDRAGNRCCAPASA